MSNISDKSFKLITLAGFFCMSLNTLYIKNCLNKRNEKINKRITDLETKLCHFEKVYTTQSKTLSKETNIKNQQYTFFDN